MTIMGLDSDQCLPIANYFKPLFHTDNSNIVDQLKEQREVKLFQLQQRESSSKRQSEATATQQYSEIHGSFPSRAG